MTSKPFLSGSNSMRRPLGIQTSTAVDAPRLLATIEQLTGVGFTRAGAGEASLCVGPTSSLRSHQQRDPVPSLQCARNDAGADGRSAERVDVQFSNDPHVPWPFRGRAVSTAVPANCAPLLPVDGERVLASNHAGPLWVVREVAGCAHFRSAMPLQEIALGGSFAHVFSGSSFLPNLPLLQLLAQFSSTGIGVEQTLRATFMFDDPNLHWSSYGYVHYAHLLQQAELENFHVSFATIPLDAWYAHPKTAKQFRDNPDRLSLLVHGNNHTRHELARESSAQGCSALLQQARQRIEQMERRAQVCVDRVMVPPHGACTANMLAALPGAGFEGACLSTGSLAAHNPGADWIRALGFRPAEQIVGCSVLPRWALVGIEHSELLLAAYLGRPLILRGHHGDLREGMDLLSSTAKFINGIGSVQWRNNSGLMASSYKLNMIGSTAHVRAFSREVAVSLPAQATSVVVEHADPDIANDRCFVSGMSTGGVVSVRYQEPMPLSVSADDTIIKITRLAALAQPDSIPTRGIDASSVLRRFLTEARDRLMPLTN